jgi:hypothetical protein
MVPDLCSKVQTSDVKVSLRINYVSNRYLAFPTNILFPFIVKDLFVIYMKISKEVKFVMLLKVV